MLTDDEQVTARALDRLSRPGAWLDQMGQAYGVRQGPDRRRRPLMIVSEAVFRALATSPGLSPQTPGGGWRLARAPARNSHHLAAGRPGLVEGERLVAEADGRLIARRVNLGARALAWLASRQDGEGRPWLQPRELSAAERLQADYEKAGVIGRLTMSWDQAPRGSGPRGRAPEPAEQARAAKARLAAALAALPPREQAVVRRVALQEEPLQAVERDLHLPRRTARLVLKAGLSTLADHYRIG